MVPSNSALQESAAAAETSVLLDPALTAEEKALQRYTSIHSTQVPTYFFTINDLRRCTSNRVVPFPDLFPLDSLSGARKVGEGSYGEVFLLPGHKRGGSSSAPVLKVVPVDGEAVVNGAAQTRWVFELN